MIIVKLIFSFAALLWAADHLVNGASGVGLYYKLPPLLVGLTLVALGTSAPEIMIAISASIEGKTDIAIGNAIGTNIANIGLVLGLMAMLKPIRIQPTLLKREYPLLFLVMLFTYSIMLNGYLGILDGCLFLLASIALFFYFAFMTQGHSSQKQLTMQFQSAIIKKRSFKSYLISLLLGLIILPLSARFLVNSCTELGAWLGISELVLGLTVIAIGTSLPELVTSLVATVKGADDIAIGNILGSNMINLLAVMVFPSLIHPSPISHAILWRDIPAMFIITLILLWANYHRKKISRWHGGILILVYFSYIASIIISASR